MKPLRRDKKDVEEMERGRKLRSWKEDGREEGVTDQKPG